MSHSSAEAGLESVLKALDQVTTGSIGLAGIGICSPGPLDPFAGVVLNPPNLPCWRNFRLAESVQKVYPVTARVDNGANGKTFHGRTGSAAEGGHISIDYQGPVCGCGKPGCIEVLASGNAIARRARKDYRGCNFRHAFHGWG